jgi:hypothetical protein
MLSSRRDNTGRLPPPVAAIERRWHNAQDGAKVGLLNPQDGTTHIDTDLRILYKMAKREEEAHERFAKARAIAQRLDAKAPARSTLSRQDL